MSEISCVVTTSPVPCHPSTEIIDQVIESIHRQLPTAPIFLLCDGVRDELKHRKEQYLFYLDELIRKYSGRINVSAYMQHMHQAGLLKAAIDEIKTPLFLFCEHDCVLDDKFIDWPAITSMLLSKEANTVRLYWHEEPHPEHTAFFGERRGLFIQTTQYSGWPFVARVDFYRELFAEFFLWEDKKMLETVLYGPFCGSPWEKFKTWIYCPENKDGIRFHHLNSRIAKDGTRDFGDW